jgi:acetate kinase
VFTAGIGEHQPEIRSAICERLAWLGVELDRQSNDGNARVISSARSQVTVLVLPTDEEQIIANETVSVLHHEDVKS